MAEPSEPFKPMVEEKKEAPLPPPPSFNVDELLAGIIDTKPKEEIRQMEQTSSLQSIPSEGKPAETNAIVKVDRKSSNPFDNVKPGTP